MKSLKAFLCFSIWFIAIVQVNGIFIHVQLKEPTDDLEPTKATPKPNEVLSENCFCNKIFNYLANIFDKDAADSSGSKTKRIHGRKIFNQLLAIASECIRKKFSSDKKFYSWGG